LQCGCNKAAANLFLSPIHFKWRLVFQWVGILIVKTQLQLPYTSR